MPFFSTFRAQYNFLHVFFPLLRHYCSLTLRIFYSNEYKIILMMMFLYLEYVVQNICFTECSLQTNPEHVEH